MEEQLLMQLIRQDIAQLLNEMSGFIINLGMAGDCERSWSGPLRELR